MQGPASISGNCQQHVLVAENGVYTNTLPASTSLTVLNPMTCFSAFAVATSGGSSCLIYSVINGYGNCNGTKFVAYANGVINVGGAGASYLPGTNPGALGTGGQLI
jgi:hypothetical protein